MGLSASSHECDYRCEKATQYQISPTASLSDNNATIGLSLIKCPMGSEGNPYRSMFVSSSKPLSNYGTKMPPIHAGGPAMNATLSSFQAKLAFMVCQAKLQKSVLTTRKRIWSPAASP